MKRPNIYVQVSLVVLCVISIFATACSSTTANPPTLVVTLSKTPTAQTLLPTATATNNPLPAWPSPTPYYSAPRDEAMDTACRITINLFFGFKQGDDIEFYHSLFTKDAQYRADSVKPPLDASMILDLMPASEEWLQDFPGTPMPGTIFPEKPDEYIYYVKFTSINREQPGINITSQSFLPPDFMTITMIVDPNAAISCKIANYGKG